MRCRCGKAEARAALNGLCPVCRWGSIADAEMAEVRDDDQIEAALDAVANRHGFAPVVLHEREPGCDDDPDETAMVDVTRIRGKIAVLRQQRERQGGET